MAEQWVDPDVQAWSGVPVRPGGSLNDEARDWLGEPVESSAETFRANLSPSNPVAGLIGHALVGWSMGERLPPATIAAKLGHLVDSLSRSSRG